MDSVIIVCGEGGDDWCRARSLGVGPARGGNCVQSGLIPVGARKAARLVEFEFGLDSQEHNDRPFPFTKAFDWCTTTDLFCAWYFVLIYNELVSDGRYMHSIE